MKLPLLQAITDGSTEAVVVVSEEMNIEYVNGRFCVLFDLRPSELIGTSLESMPNLQPIYNVIEKAISTSRAYPSRTTSILSGNELQFSDSYQIHIDFISIEGSLFYILRFNEMMTDSVSLLPSGLDAAWILESLLDGVIVVDEKGIIRYVNSAFCGMIDRTFNDIIGNKWITFTSYPDDDIIFEKIALRRAGEVERYEIEWVRSDGSVFPSYISAVPFHDRFGSFKGSIGVVTDITELKEHESALKFYINLLTHDIPNQLQVVLTAASLLDENLPTSYVNEARVTINEAIERCTRLIVKVKRAAKMRDLPIREINLTEVIREKIKVVKRIYQAKVHLDNFKETILVRANTLLGELIWNLLENAARHNPKPNRHIWIRGIEIHEYFSLSIEDNGPGISEAKKKILFDASQRTGGVGLTLVARMVQECGGRIEVQDRIEGRPDQGSKFILYLPLAE